MRRMTSSQRVTENYQNQFKAQNYLFWTNRILGKGSMGVAYEGLDLATNRKVCVKMVKIRSVLQETMFKREIQVLKELKDHPNLMNYIQDFSYAQHQLLISERCDRTLAKQIISCKKLTEIKALKYFIQILEGYTQMRTKSYIHRDLKPENIMLKQGQIKIGDFGYAVKIGHNLNDCVNVGTPFYMAPEALTRNSYSQASDIWSLGITLYEMIGGKIPYKSKTEANLREEMLKPFTALPCKEQVWRLISGCLKVYKNQRWSLLELMVQCRSCLEMLEKEIWENQINYIKYLRYLEDLRQRCEVGKEDRKLKFMIQYMARMKLQFFKMKVENQEEYGQDFKEIEDSYGSQIDLSPAILNDLPRELTKLQITNKESQWYHLQTLLRQTISHHYSKISKFRTSNDLLYNEQNIFFFDFLLTLFQLNAKIINAEDDVEEFSYGSYLKVILEAPRRMSMEVYEAVKQKYEKIIGV